MRAAICLPLLLTGVLFSSSIFANNGTSAFNSTSMYFGIQAGGEDTVIDVTNSYFPGSVNGLNASGLTYGPYVGIQLAPPSWNKFNAAVEFFYEWISNATNNYTLANPNNPTTFQKKNNLGVSILPGYFLNDNLKIYARLGYVNSQFNTTNAFGSGFTYYANANGGEVGLGLVYKLWKDLGLRAEVDFIQYASVSNHSGINSQTLKNQSSDYKLGLQWSL